MKSKDVAELRGRFGAVETLGTNNYRSIALDALTLLESLSAGPQWKYPTAEDYIGASKIFPTISSRVTEGFNAARELLPLPKPFTEFGEGEPS